MHIIDNGKETVVYTQILRETTVKNLNDCEILFKQEVVLSENNQQAQLIIVKKDDPSEIISKRVDVSIRPADRAFIHTADAKFVQGQEILVGIVHDEQTKGITLFPCGVMDIIPNGYLR